jgi:negative regulator of sigma E activity
MNPQNQQDWERKLQELEIEIHQTPSKMSNSEPPKPQFNDRETSPQLQKLWLQVRNWFNGLPQGGKAIALLLAVLLGFSLLRTFLQLISAAIGMTILGVLLYAAYKFFIAPPSSQS